MAQLSAHFTVDVNSSCPSLIAHFTNTSTGPFVRSHWVFNTAIPGDTSTTSAPIQTWIYSTPGYYTVKLVIYDAAGNSDSVVAVNEIYVSPKPVIRFTASDTILSCPPQTITFINTSDTGGCTPTFTWIIDTSSSMHSDTVSYTFTHAGLYNISLQETDACNCDTSFTKTAYIKIDSSPVVCFTTSDTLLCSPPVSVCFNNCTVGGVNYLWQFGDGSTPDTAINPCHTYTTGGNYTDTLVAFADDGCPDTLIKSSYIAVRNFTPGFYLAAPPCAKAAIAFQDTTTGATFYHWHLATPVADTSDASIAFFTYAAIGIYTVKDSVWSNIGCHGVATKTFTVFSNPFVSITATDTFRCAPNDTVQFTSVVTDAANIVSRIWNFGDATSSIYNVAYSDSTHIYTDTGKFLPSVVITDSNGCITRDTFLRGIKITDTKGYLHVSRDSGCVPFILHYTTSDTPVVTYFTDSVTFGDGASATTDTGTHTYTGEGQYWVHHYYHLPAGCSYSDSIKVLVGVHATYSVTQTADSTCQGIDVVLAGNCTTCTHETWICSAFPSNYYIDTINILFGGEGGYQTILYNADDNGCVDTVHTSMYVFEPSANFITYKTCGERYSYYFYPEYIDGDGATNYYWSFGDGTTATTEEAIHTFPGYGTYTVRLQDSDAVSNGGHGCFTSSSQVITIAPFADSFHVSNYIACTSQTITFDGPLTAAGDKYTYYGWVFGDGTSVASYSGASTGYSNAVTHGYSHVGVFEDSMTIQDKFGCDTVIKGTIRIVAPSGGITVTDESGDSVLGCAPLTVTFHDNNDTATPGFYITSRHWIWNEGGTAVHGYGADTTHTYPLGIYHAILIDSDNYHCFSFDTININSIKPIAYFTSPDTIACIQVPIAFIDTNTGCSYTWYFGDGSPPDSTGPDVTHIYTANGIYTDSLIIVSLPGGGFPLAGCIDTEIRTHYVNINPTPINPGFTLNNTFKACPPSLVLAYSPDPYYHQWKFGLDSSTINATSADTTFVYNYPGIYVITLIDSNALGCKDSLKKLDTVAGPTGTISISPAIGCIGFTTTLHLSSPDVLDPLYTWSLLPYGILTTDTPGISQVCSDSGKWNPYVIIEKNGCQVTVKTTDSISVFPSELNVHQPEFIKCKYSDPDTLTVSGLVSGYSWSPAYGLSCTSCIATFANPLITTIYTFTGTNGYGCIEIHIDTVKVDVPPLITISGIDIICKGAWDTLAVSAGLSTPLLWLPAGGVSCACDTVFASPVSSQTYTFIGADANNCRDSAAFHVTVDTIPVVKTNPADTSICVGASFNIIANGAVTYNWLPATGLSCSSCSITTSTATGSITYTITGTDANGCKDSATTVVHVDPALPYTGSITGDTILCVGTVKVLTDTVAGGIWSIDNTVSATVSSAGELTGIAAGIDTVKYTFINSCGSSSALFPLVVDANPVANISTHSFPAACYNTEYQNFGTEVAAPSGVSYIWTANNASLYAVGAGNQYCLVSFPEEGTGVVVLTAINMGEGCRSIDSFIVNVGSGESPLPGVAFYGGNELVCLDNTANSYQWGYDNRITLDSSIIAGELNQDYFIDSPDFANRYYWVMTMHGECLQKTYYNEPTAVSNVAVANPEILLFPNPADEKINMEIKGIGKSDSIEMKLFDMAGNTIYKNSIGNGQGILDLSKMASGVYLVMFSENGNIIGSKTFVKN